eukprot:UC1_evm1s193
MPQQLVKVIDSCREAGIRLIIVVPCLPSKFTLLQNPEEGGGSLDDVVEEDVEGIVDVDVQVTSLFDPYFRRAKATTTAHSVYARQNWHAVSVINNEALRLAKGHSPCGRLTEVPPWFFWEKAVVLIYVRVSKTDKNKKKDEKDVPLYNSSLSTQETIISICLGQRFDGPGKRFKVIKGTGLGCTGNPTSFRDLGAYAAILKAAEEGNENTPRRAIVAVAWNRISRMNKANNMALIEFALQKQVHIFVLESCLGHVDEPNYTHMTNVTELSAADLDAFLDAQIVHRDFLDNFSLDPQLKEAAKKMEGYLRERKVGDEEGQEGEENVAAQSAAGTGQGGTKFGARARFHIPQEHTQFAHSVLGPRTQVAVADISPGVTAYDKHLEGGGVQRRTEALSILARAPTVRFAFVGLPRPPSMEVGAQPYMCRYCTKE